MHYPTKVLGLYNYKVQFLKTNCSRQEELATELLLTHPGRLTGLLGACPAVLPQLQCH